jgi:tetratricopeptide (TPR) repeat protein
VKPGDQLVGVGQERGGGIVDVRRKTLSQIVPLLRGEPGTMVRLEVIPKGRSETRIYEIQRDRTTAWLKAVVEAIDTDPWRRQVREASALDDEGQRRPALENLAKQADVGQQPLWIMLRLTRQLEQVDATESASRLLRQMQQRHPGEVWANIALARSLAESKPPQLEEAIRYYTAAVALRPDSAGLHINLGNALHAQGKQDEAMAEYREARRLRTDYATAHYNLGLTLQRQRKRKEAISEFREALRLQPDYAKAHASLASALQIGGEPEEVLAEYRLALRFDPEDAETHFGLGFALQKQGKLDEAVVEYREALRLQPKNADLHLRVGRALKDQEKLDEAIATYRAGLRVKPDAAGLRYLLAESLNKQGKVEESAAELREILRLHPDAANAHNALAWLLATAADASWRKPAEAYEHAKKAVGRSSNVASYWNTLGVAAYRTGAWEEAIAALKKSDERTDRGRGINWLFLAMAHWRLGQQDEARRWYTRAATWMKFNKVDDELARFRAEADHLSGIADTLPASREEPKSPRPARFPVARFKPVERAPATSGTPALFVLNHADSGVEQDKFEHDALQLLTSTGERLWSHEGFKNAEEVGGVPVAIDRKRGRIYAMENTADRINAFDLQGNKLWQIQRIKVSTLLVDERTGNLWCSGGPLLNTGETIVFDGGGNEVAAYPCRAVDIAYDPQTDAFWLVGYQIVKLTRSGEVLFREDVDGWCCRCASINPRDGSIWIAESRHRDRVRSKNCLWLRNADGSVRHKIDLGDTTVLALACVAATGDVLFNGRQGLCRASPDGKVSELGALQARNIAVSPTGGAIWLTTESAIIRIDEEGSVQLRVPLAALSARSWIAAF